MESIENYLKRLEKHTYLYFQNLYLHHSNIKYFSSKEECSFSLKKLDITFENTKVYSKEKIKEFLLDIQKEDLTKVILLLENEKSKIENLLSKHNYELEDYKTEDYICYIIQCIFFEHLESLLYNMKKKICEKAIYEDMCADLHDYSVQYIRDILKVFPDKKIYKNE